MTKHAADPATAKRSRALTTAARQRQLRRRSAVSDVDRICAGGEARDLYHTLVSMTWPRFFLGIVLWYLAANLIFAAAYALCGPGSFDGLEASHGFAYFLDCFFFSVQTFATIGYGHVSPRSIGANVLVTFEALAGVLTISLITGVLFGRFSRPTARILFSDVAVISTIDGVPCLLIRMANERRNVIASAEAQVTLLVIEKTSEGETYRNFHDLALERSSTPMLALSWTLVHPLDEKSPLFGATRESLHECQALLLVTVAGIDDTLVQPIHARYTYAPDEILWDRRFVDMLVRNKSHRLELHLERIHDTREA